MRGVIGGMMLAALLALPARGQTLGPGSDISAGGVKATASTALRPAADRAADTCNILDQMPTSGDAAVAFTACVGTGKGTILFPPGAYVVQSLTSTDGSHNLPPAAFVLSGVTERHVVATGATFTMANAITNGSNAYFIPWNNSKRISWDGGYFAINPNSTTGTGQLFTGMCWQSVVNLSITNVFIDGTTANTSAMCGVWGFDVLVSNVTGLSLSIGTDFAYNQDITIANNHFFGSATGSAGMTIFSDTATTGANNTGRTLRNGQGNGLRILNNTVSGFHTQIALDGQNGALVQGNLLVGPTTPWTTGSNAGILLQTSAATNTAGYTTQNIIVANNTITGNGNSTTTSANAGILLATNTYGLKNVTISTNAIYDNCGNGIGPTSLANVGVISVYNNDFATRGSGACTQANPIDPATVSFMGSLMPIFGNTGITSAIDGTAIGQNTAAAGAFTTATASSAILGGGSALGTTPFLIGKQRANGADGSIFQRFTDTSPTGQIWRLLNAGNSANLALIDVAGNATWNSVTAPTAILGGGAIAGVTSPFMTGRQAANGNDGVVFQRNTDTSPTGNFMRLLNAGGSANLMRIDINGNGTFNSMTTPSAVLGGGAVAGATPFMTGKQSADGNDGVVLQRAIDSSPTGYFLRLLNAAGSANLALIDISGNATFAGVTAPAGTFSNTVTSPLAVLGGGVIAGVTSPFMTGRQAANGNDGAVFQRNTDTSPTGNFWRLVNAAGSANLARVDINGNATFAGMTSSGGTIDGTVIGGTTPASGTFTGVTAPTGTFGTSVTAPTGTFSAAVTAPTGTFATSVTAPTGTFGTAVSAPTGTFATAVTAPTGTFATSVTSPAGTFTTAVTAPNGTFSTAVTAPSGTFSTSVTAPTGTFSTSVTAPTGTFATAVTAPAGTFATSVAAPTGTFSTAVTAPTGSFATSVTAPTAILGTSFSGGTTPFLTGKQLANGGDGVVFQRNTDTSPSGSILRLTNAANSANLARIDISGGATFAAYTAGSSAGVSCTAGTVSLSTLVVTGGIVTHC